MPPLMLRSSLFGTAIVALGSIMPAAWAADPLCPSQIAQPLTLGTAPAATPATPASAAAVKSARAKAAENGNIDVTADSVDADANRNTATLRGNVEVRQGDR